MEAFTAVAGPAAESAKLALCTKMPSTAASAQVTRHLPRATVDGRKHASRVTPCGQFMTWGRCVMTAISWVREAVSQATRPRPAYRRARAAEMHFRPGANRFSRPAEAAEATSASGSPLFKYLFGVSPVFLSIIEHDHLFQH